VADELGIISSSLDFVNKEEAGRNSIIKPPTLRRLSILRPTLSLLELLTWV